VELTGLAPVVPLSVPFKNSISSDSSDLSIVGIGRWWLQQWIQHDLGRAMPVSTNRMQGFLRGSVIAIEACA
jgi:hypothetical protein